MQHQVEINEYKQQIADMYTRRSATYDQSDWHHSIAHRLVEYAQVQPQQQLLDIATGTGIVAIAAAQIIGNEGKVIGIDISQGMLEQAQQKVDKLGLTNIEFHFADAENLPFPENSFDCILCSSAFIWMFDLVGVLKHWYRFLKPGGLLGFHAFAETSFVSGTVAQNIFKKYGISLLLNQPTGTIEKCHNLLQTAGYSQIEIKTEQEGTYQKLENVKDMWCANTNSYPFPGQFPNPLLQMTPEQLAQAKIEFDAQVDQLETEQGVWNDVTIFYVFARKNI